MNTEKYFVDKHSLNNIRAVLFFLMLTAIAALYILFVWLHRRYPEYFRIDISTLPEIIIWIAAILFITGYVFSAAVILPGILRTACYSVNFDEITLEVGIFFKQRTVMNLSAVSYATTVNCRIFNILIVSGTGGRLILPFRSDKDIRKLLRKIKDYIINRGGA
jgi:membrane protein YdbS with pleckstrin-like domain